MAARNKPAPPSFDPPDADGFRGFGSQALAFLLALRENNDRDWFNGNKSTYLDECDAPLRALVRAIGAGLEARGIPFAPSAKSPVFRIYRDVRFGRDKSPYKTNLGAALFPGGDKSRSGLLYIHVEPGRSFLAAGFYQPATDRLRAYRVTIAADPVGFAALLQTLAARGLHLDDGDPLARMPRGFEHCADSPVASSLRKRSLITSRPLADDDLERTDLPALAVQFANDALPLLEYLASLRQGDSP